MRDFLSSIKTASYILYVPCKWQTCDEWLDGLSELPNGCKLYVDVYDAGQRSVSLRHFLKTAALPRFEVCAIVKK